MSSPLLRGAMPLLLGAAVCVAVRPGSSQPPQKDKSDPQKLHGENFTQLYGAKGCINNCHDKALGVPEKYYEIVRGVEGTIWSTHDRHRDAFLALSGLRAKKMEKILQGSGTGWEKGVAGDARCVSCHGVVIDKGVTLNPDMVALHPDGTVDLTKEGVTCMVCHGLDSRWFDPHQSLPNRRKWRMLNGAEKQAQYGMTDLWDPVERATLCSACHVGNGKDKMVTHEMYAAGHPPLPGFEIASFSDAMPRHWETIQEKKARILKQPLEEATKKELIDVLEKKFRYINRQLDQTDMVVTGGVVALRQSYQMLAEQAKQGAAWPELAVFDCYACHHDLKIESWRQERGYPGKPGRPNMRSWPTPLAQLALFHIAAKDAAAEKALSDDLAKQINEVARAFDEKPFGRSEKVESAARDVVKWLDGNLIGPLHPQAKAFKVMDQKASHDLLDRLVSFPLEKGKYPLDFDAARQVGWAFKLIQAEAYPDKENAALAERLGGPLKTLDKALFLDLPRGKPADQKGYKENEFLWQALGQLNNYSPAEFRADLTALRKAWLESGGKRP